MFHLLACIIWGKGVPGAYGWRIKFYAITGTGGATSENELMSEGGSGSEGNSQAAGQTVRGGRGVFFFCTSA